MIRLPLSLWAIAFAMGALLPGSARAGDLSLNNGVVYHDVVVTEYGPDFLRIRHRDGVARVMVAELSSDWQKKLEPTMAKAKAAHTDQAWLAKLEAAERRQSQEMARKVKVTLTSELPAGKGRRGAMRDTVKVGKKSTEVLTDVLIIGLPPGYGAVYMGAAMPDGVYSDYDSKLVLPRWRVK